MPSKIVSPEEWRTARLSLLTKEKEHTRRADELAKLRAEMPVTEVTKEYTFTGPSGPCSLSELFGGRRQLLIYHLMFDPDWETPCSSCSFLVDQMPTRLEHLHSRDTTLAFVSRAPIEKIRDFQKRMGWSHIDWVSSGGSDFNYDYHVTLDEAVAPAEYNFRTAAEHMEKGMDHFTRGEQPGLSVFVKDGEKVMHSYSCYSRGADHLLTTCGLLDLTPLGRQDKNQAEGLGFKYHDEY